MYTRQDDLLGPARLRRPNIENDVGNGPAPTLSPGDRGNAERTVIITAILHLDESARATMEARQWFASNRFEVK